MAQLFSAVWNVVAKAILAGGFILLGIAVWAIAGFNLSPYMTRVGVPQSQPVPFSHKQHVGQLGIDCLFCHTSVEKAPFAGMPPAATCMKCHKVILKESPLLAPVRESFEKGTPLRWTRVHDLPDFVYFDHSVHVSKGIGCVSCHGEVDKMPLLWKSETLHMKWCLECHRHPGNFVKGEWSGNEMKGKPAAKMAATGQKQALLWQSKTNCSSCHR